MSKTVKIIEKAVEQDEGVGARVRRSIGRNQLTCDPFLLLDEFKVGQPAGFPDHPHRGFETWMTAGRGIVHCEMPYGDGISCGLQLWVNLHSTQKMIAPAYQELSAKEIKQATKDGVTVKVIAGEAFDVKSEVLTRTPTTFLDFKMQKDSCLSQPIPFGWNSFVYVLSGEARFGPEEQSTLGRAQHLLVLSDLGDHLKVNATSEECRFVLLAGQPLKENIVQHGVFVMTTEEEIEQAKKDFQHCQNGFEQARDWNSFVVYEDDDPSTLLV